MESPTRHWLGHSIPNWVDPNDQVFFITICCKKRGSDQLTRGLTPKELIASAKLRIERKVWHPFVFLIMPDHVHLIARFGTESKGLVSEVRNWKSWTAKSLEIDWQRGFFDHRIRDERSFSEKHEYILQNPVRSGLVTKPEEWEWKLIPKD